MNQQSNRYQRKTAQKSCLPNQSEISQDEIDLKELLNALWKVKWFIATCVLICTVAATIYAFSKPNVYEANFKMLVVDDPYALGLEQNNLNAHYLASVMLSPKFTSEVTKRTGVSVSIGISVDVTGNVSIINIFKQGEDPQDIYSELKAYRDSVGHILKEMEMANLELASYEVERVLMKIAEPRIAEVLAEKNALQLYKLALLKSSSTDLIHVLTEPEKPIQQVKPMRILIIIQGFLLGLTLGICSMIMRSIYLKNKKS